MLDLTESFLDSVDLDTFDELGKQGLVVDTPLIKARKIIADTEQDTDVQTSDGGGLKMAAEQMKQALKGETGASVNLASFEANMFA